MTTPIPDDQNIPLMRKRIEELEQSLASYLSPDPSLPSLDPDAPKRTMLVEIRVSSNFEGRLDNQWMVETEIRADRWKWWWADEYSPIQKEQP